MAAVALCIGVLAAQARSAGVFGPRLAIFSWIVAAILLLSYLFLPIAALFVWIIVCLVASRRNAPATTTPLSELDTRPVRHSDTVSS